MKTADAHAALTTAAIDRLAGAYHDLHCRSLFGPDREHTQTGFELDRAKARFLLAAVAEDGWRLVHVSDPADSTGGD